MFNFWLIFGFKTWKFNTLSYVFFSIYIYKVFWKSDVFYIFYSHFKFFEDKLYIILLHRSSAQNRFLSNATIAFKFNTILNTILSEDRRDDGQTSTTADLLHTADLPIFFIYTVRKEIYSDINMIILLIVTWSIASSNIEDQCIYVLKF